MLAVSAILSPKENRCVHISLKLSPVFQSHRLLPQPQDHRGCWVLGFCTQCSGEDTHCHPYVCVLSILTNCFHSNWCFYSFKTIMNREDMGQRSLLYDVVGRGRGVRHLAKPTGGTAASTYPHMKLSCYLVTACQCRLTNHTNQVTYCKR